MFYTYVDWTLENPSRPFYVGKGTADRVSLLQRRNPRHTAIRKAHGIRREVVLQTMDEREAMLRERELILELKTRGDVDGEWGANFTIGGEGVVGRKHDDATKQRISRSLTGRRLSAQIRMNMRRAQSKIPINQYDSAGRFVATYPTQCEAQRATGVAQSNIYKCCRGKLRSAGGYVWRYANEPSGELK